MSWENKTEKVLDICMDTFGVDDDGRFVYQPKSGLSYKVRGIFDDEYQEADPNTEASVSSKIPILGVKLSDLQTTPKKGDKVIVKGISYLIYDVQKDVHGGAKLYLHKV